MNNFYSRILLFTVMLLMSVTSKSQEVNSSKAELDFSGTINANTNGFSLVPTFSLGEPALQTGFNFSGKSRFSLHPQFWYSLLDYKPWSFILIGRYHLVDQDRFDFYLGVHAPALNFKSANVIEDGVQKDIINARRFYPPLEILGAYELRENISLGIYGILGRGLDKEVATTNTFLAIRIDFNEITVSDKLFLKLNPQLYFLGIDSDTGLYTSGGLTLEHEDWPISISAMMNKAVVSEIDVSDFEWNVGVTYSFGMDFIER